MDNKKYPKDTLLTDIINNDLEFEFFKTYFQHIKLEDLKHLSVDDLRNTYFLDDKINNINVPNSSNLINKYDILLDKFIKKYLLDYIKKPESCEEDHCYWSYKYKNKNPDSNKAVHYSCLNWVCQKDINQHTKKFVCDICKIEQCECHTLLQSSDEHVCWACEDDMEKNYSLGFKKISITK